MTVATQYRDVNALCGRSTAGDDVVGASDGMAGAMPLDGVEYAYLADRIRHYDGLADAKVSATSFARAYHRRLTEVYAFHIQPGSRVLEVGCGQGDLLAAVRPSYGVGVDFSGGMIEKARRRHPEGHFHWAEGDAHTFVHEGAAFDYVIVSDLLGDAWNVQRMFKNLREHCHAGTRVIINTYSRLWETPLTLARRAGLATPTLQQNWFTVHDVRNLLSLTGFETLRAWPEVLCPAPLGPVSRFCNRVLSRVLPFRWLALTNFLIARPQAEAAATERDRGADEVVSVVVPARNEAGNIQEILRRVPEMGAGTELIFVEGNSTDDTWEVIQREVPGSGRSRCKMLQQPGKGKGDAVRAGFAAASGDIFMILDADLTVAPEDLPLFVEALQSGRGEFVNGVRLVYPMQQRAMRFCNLVGNKFFSWAFSCVLGQPIRDTLCGTKVLRRKDYERIVEQRGYFGDFDPFGDFDLLFGAAHLDLKTVDLPIRYRERTYGDTNISRWRHGVVLLRMLLFAARRLKFV